MEADTEQVVRERFPIEPVDIDDDEQVDRAMKRAVAAAVLRHKLKGEYVIGWKDGQVIRVEPEHIVVPEIE